MMEKGYAFSEGFWRQEAEFFQKMTKDRFSLANTKDLVCGYYNRRGDFLEENSTHNTVLEIILQKVLNPVEKTD